MRFRRVSHTPFSHRVGRYRFQMAQAKLNTPVEPVFTYSLQPFYARQQEWMTELAHSLSRLYRFSAELDQAAMEFDPDRKNSAINGRIATSSLPDAVLAEALPGAEPAAYQLTVHRLASGQINHSLQAGHDEPSPVQPGQHVFTLSVTDQEKELSFYSNKTDTVIDSLRKISRLINQSKLGVSARMEHTGEQASLVIASTRTGASQAFSLHDVAGNSIRAFGLDQVETLAHDADLVLHHQRLQTDSNQLLTGDGNVRLTLLQADRNKPVRIEVATDTERLFLQTKKLVHRYNRLLAFLHEHQDVLSTQKLGTFTRIAHAADRVLPRYGLSRADNGELDLDESTWREAISTDYAGFAAEMKGLARQFREETVKIQTTPLGSFSHSYADLQNANPYAARSWSSLQYRYATAAGMYVDFRW